MRGSSPQTTAWWEGPRWARGRPQPILWPVRPVCTQTFLPHFLGPWAPLCPTSQISISLSIDMLHEMPNVVPPGAKPAGSSQGAGHRHVLPTAAAAAMTVISVVIISDAEPAATAGVPEH